MMLSEMNRGPMFARWFTGRREMTWWGCGERLVGPALLVRVTMEAHVTRTVPKNTVEYFGDTCEKMGSTPLEVKHNEGSVEFSISCSLSQLRSSYSWDKSRAEICVFMWESLHRWRTFPRRSSTVSTYWSWLFPDQWPALVRYDQLLFFAVYVIYKKNYYFSQYM